MHSKRSIVDSNRMRKLRWQNAMDNNKLLKQLAEKRKQRIKPIVPPVYDNVDEDDEDYDVVEDMEDYDVVEDMVDYGDDDVGSIQNAKIETLREENRNLSEERDALKATNERLSEVCEALTADVKQLERKRKGLEQENDGLHQRILERQRLDKQYGEVVEWVNRCKELVEENESLRIELNNLDYVNASWTERYERLEMTYERLLGGRELDDLDDTFGDAAFLKTVVFFLLMFLVYNLLSFALLNWETGEQRTQLPW